jgi:hypothetical protein
LIPRQPVSGAGAKLLCALDTSDPEYYHRHVTLMLLPGNQSLRFLLDVEPQRPGEDEVACALRLLTRLLQRYPRAFDVVLADALLKVA